MLVLWIQIKAYDISEMAVVYAYSAYFYFGGWSDSMSDNLSLTDKVSRRKKLLYSCYTTFKDMDLYSEPLSKPRTADNRWVYSHLGIHILNISVYP